MGGTKASTYVHPYHITVTVKDPHVVELNKPSPVDDPRPVSLTSYLRHHRCHCGSLVRPQCSFTPARVLPIAPSRCCHSKL